MARVDYDKQAAVYDRGRDLPPEAIAVWMATARRHIGEDARAILDLGSGTGRFSGPLADLFEADVVAVEPSSGMRAQAKTKAQTRVRIVGGSAEHLPLGTGSCGAAWLSNVIHHFDDIPSAAAELRRVVVEGGSVLVRGAFADRGPIPSLFKFFPGAERVIDDFPTVAELVDTFQGAGFPSMSIEKVEQLVAYSLSEMIERVKLRADTALELLEDDEFARGVAAMQDAAKQDDGPVSDPLDLLVLR